MDIFKLSYSGRISAGKLKRFNPDPVSEQSLSEDELWWAQSLRTHGLEQTIEARATLGLSSPPNLQNPSESSHRARRGSAGITSHGRGIVQDAACLLQESSPPRTLSFLTLTIPPQFLVPAVVHEWAGIVRKMRQAVSYQLQKGGLDGQIVGVTEIQSRRALQSGCVPPLHLHWVFQGRRQGSGWLLGTDWIDRTWLRLLQDATGIEGSVQSACNIQMVKKSVAGYLGKYMSKGGADVNQYDPELLPSSWYTCTRGLRSAVTRSTIYVTGKRATELFDWAATGGVELRWSKYIYLETNDGRKIAVGWCGQVKSRDDYFDFVKNYYDLLDTETLP